MLLLYYNHIIKACQENQPLENNYPQIILDFSLLLITSTL